MGSSSPQLAAMMAGTAAKALNLLAERAEYSAASGPELRQMAPSSSGGATAGPNSAQLRNIALCSQLQETHRSLSALLTRLPPTAAPALGGALAAVQATAVDAVAPIFRAVVEACEERILRMHDWQGYRVGATAEGEDGAAAMASGPEVTSTSPHVAEVAALLTDFRGEFLSRFVPPPTPSVASCVGSLVERMACRLLVFFVRHASLLRPLTKAGKLLVSCDASLRQRCPAWRRCVDQVASYIHIQYHSSGLTFFSSSGLWLAFNGKSCFDGQGIVFRATWIPHAEGKVACAHQLSTLLPYVIIIFHMLVNLFPLICAGGKGLG